MCVSMQSMIFFAYQYIPDPKTIFEGVPFLVETSEKGDGSKKIRDIGSALDTFLPDPAFWHIPWPNKFGPTGRWLQDRIDSADVTR